MSQHTSTNQQPNNILSFAQIWLQNNVGRISQNQADEVSLNHPLDRALYQRVCHIDDQLAAENRNYVSSVKR